MRRDGIGIRDEHGTWGSKKGKKTEVLKHLGLNPVFLKTEYLMLKNTCAHWLSISFYWLVKLSIFLLETLQYLSSLLKEVKDMKNYRQTYPSTIILCNGPKPHFSFSIIYSVGQLLLVLRFLCEINLLCKIHLSTGKFYLLSCVHFSPVKSALKAHEIY